MLGWSSQLWLGWPCVFGLDASAAPAIETSTEHTTAVTTSSFRTIDPLLSVSPALGTTSRQGPWVSSVGQLTEEAWPTRTHLPDKIPQLRQRREEVGARHSQSGVAPRYPASR